MFILFGTTGRWSTHHHDGGDFFCPNCGGDRQWVRCVLRRWFSVFFLPVVPMGKPVATAVQCTTCRQRFDQAVLGQPTSGVLTAELQGTMRLAATEVVRAAGPAADAEAVVAVRRLGLDVYDQGSLTHDVATLDGSTLDPHLAYLSETLSLQGREQLLTTLAAIARSAGEPGATNARPVLERIGAGLGMSPAHVNGVVGGSPAPHAGRPFSPPDPTDRRS